MHATNASMTMEAFKDYCETIVVPEVQRRRRAAQEKLEKQAKYLLRTGTGTIQDKEKDFRNFPAIFLLDNHISHLSFDASNCTSFMQPADVGLNGSLKSFLRKSLREVTTFTNFHRLTCPQRYATRFERHGLWF